MGAHEACNFEDTDRNRGAPPLIYYFARSKYIMPYFLDGNCVMKGTKGNPQGTVKCHPTHKEALDHLRALEVNVKDAKSSLDNVPDRYHVKLITKDYNER